MPPLDFSANFVRFQRYGADRSGLVPGCKNGLSIYWEADIFELWANVLIDFSRTR